MGNHIEELEKAAEVRAAAAVLSDRITAHDVAPRFLCSEVEALATLLRHVGAEDAAKTWIQEHAEQEDEGCDCHDLTKEAQP